MHCLGLPQGNSVGPRVDFGEHVALFYRLPLGKQHLGQPPIDLGLERHGIKRRHAAQALERDRHVVLHSHCRQNRRRFLRFYGLAQAAMCAARLAHRAALAAKALPSQPAAAAKGC